MTSKVWPPPNEVEQAMIEDNPLEHVECEDCGCDPCQCDWCGDCGNESCTCDICEMCECEECECPDVYVVYTTKVVVYVDCDGDLGKVTVMADLDEPVDVQNGDGYSLSNGDRYRERALEIVANREWPSWDIE